MFPLYFISEYWYCPRAALLYILRENYRPKLNKDYIKGIYQHKKIDTLGERYKKGLKQIKQFEVYSDKLNIAGKLDLLEISGKNIYPVELKKGKLREAPQIIMQIKIQILVLEDFLKQEIPYGYASFSEPHERLKITMTKKEKISLRKQILEIQQKVHQQNPFPFFPKAQDQRCAKCSFNPFCY